VKFLLMVLYLSGKKVWVAGHNGMVGSALVKQLEALGSEILTVARSELDLRDQAETRKWLKENKPESIIIAAAKVGGIWANNTDPIAFLYDNLMIEVNIIEAAAKIGVEKLMLLGTGCIYPKLTEQPIQESSLLSGPLEPTNEWYAIAKIAGIKLCQAYKKQHGLNFISAMPTNLYGPKDNFNLETSHFLPAIMRKTHLAKKENAKDITVWGTGKPRRELMHVHDCADALIHVMQNYDEIEPINIGTGEDMSIQYIAELVAEIIGWNGEFVYDTSKPDGTLRKLLSVDKLRKLGWQHKIHPREGIKQVYDWFLENEERILSTT
jgi:GDP-L-fucose synthase